MNYRYINNLNIKSKSMIDLRKKAKQICKNWRTPKVIQIGVGGATSSAKTVLIDAIYAILGDPQRIPDYLPPEYLNKVKLSPVTDAFENSNFRDLGLLISKVHTTFDKEDNKTQPGEAWEYETYLINFQYEHSKRILLIRNISGETFSRYFSAINNNTENITLDFLFRNFIKKSNFKKTYKHLFDYKAFGEDSENKANELKMVFFNSIEKQLKTYYKLNDAAIENYKYVFYDYLFYISSTITIKCIKSVLDSNPKKKDEERSINSLMRSTKRALADYECLTQIDRIMLDTYIKKTDFFNDKNLKFDQYIQIMSKIHQDTINCTTVTHAKNNSTEIFDLTKWRAIGETFVQDNLFPITAAFSYTNNRFFKFRGQDNNNSTTDTWGETNNNNRRTPLGAVELVYCILKKGGGIDIKEFKTNKIGTTPYLDKLEIANK